MQPATDVTNRLSCHNFGGERFEVQVAAAPLAAPSPTAAPRPGSGAPSIKAHKLCAARAAAAKLKP